MLCILAVLLSSVQIISMLPCDTVAVSLTCFYIVQELLSLLSANLCATKFERNEAALRHHLEYAEAVLARHTATLRHGIDVSDLISEHKVLLLQML